MLPKGGFCIAVLNYLCKCNCGVLSLYCCLLMEMPVVLFSAYLFLMVGSINSVLMSRSLGMQFPNVRMSLH